MVTKSMPIVSWIPDSKASFNFVPTPSVPATKYESPEQSTNGEILTYDIGHYQMQLKQPENSEQENHVDLYKKVIELQQTINTGTALRVRVVNVSTYVDTHTHNYTSSNTSVLLCHYHQSRVSAK